jgi:hypothetical protein
MVCEGEPGVLSSRPTFAARRRAWRLCSSSWSLGGRFFSAPKSTTWRASPGPNLANDVLATPCRLRRSWIGSAERERLAALERENRELRRANEILKAASAFFAAELDRPDRR